MERRTGINRPSAYNKRRRRRRRRRKEEEEEEKKKKKRRRRSEKRLLALSCLSVCPSGWKTSDPNPEIFMKFII